MKKILTLISFVLVIQMAGCVNVLTGTDGNGNIVKEERNVASFDKIDASGGIDLQLVKEATSFVEVETDENLLALVETYVRGNTLYISTKNIRNSTTLTARVGYQTIKAMELSGAVDIFAENTLESDNLNIKSSGASEMDLKIMATTLDIGTSGASEITLSGKTETLSFHGSGASSLDASELEAENCEIEISGAGNALVYVTQELRASVSGAGSIRYSGNPEKVKTSVSGAGSVSRK